MNGAIGNQLSAFSYNELADRLRYPDEPAMQEVYIQTFEFNPACTLEIGWHLFGENYERGEFLVRMREALRRHGVAETTELPDHLTHILQLVARMDHDDASDLAADCILPALDKIQLPEDNPYGAALDAIRDKLRADFPDAPRRRVELPIFQEGACE